MTVKTYHRILLLSLNLLGGLVWLALSLGGQPAYAQGEVYTIPCLGHIGNLLFAEAIDKANAAIGPDTIELAANCSYNFLNPFDYPNKAALPEITDDLLIRGNGATLQRTSSTQQFRIIQVGGKAQVAIENLTIRKGQLDSSIADRSGGGIYAKNGTHLTLKGVVVQDNRGTEGGGAAVLGSATIIDSAFLDNRGETGGGLFTTGPVVISNTTFLRNEAQNGGGLYNENTVSISGSRFEHNLASGRDGGGLLAKGNITLNDTEIISNTTRFKGGGLYVEQAAAEIVDGQLADNRADSGGGVYIDRGTLTINGTALLSHTTRLDGGGIQANLSDVTMIGGRMIGNKSESNGGGLSISDGSLIMRGTTVRSNTGRSGGGLSIETAAIDDSHFENNQAETLGGAIEASNLTLNNSTFIGNRAVQSGGVFTGEAGTLVGNTFIGNLADIGAAVTLGRIVRLNNNLWVDNISTKTRFELRQLRSIIAIAGTQEGDNGRIHHNTVTTATPVDAPAFLFANTTANLRNNIITGHAIGIKNFEDLAIVTADHNLYFGNTTNEVGDINSSDNVEADPRFVDPANGDFHLQTGSQAIDKGTDVGVTVDFDGTVRPQGKGFDMGAFEFKRTTPNPGDSFTVYLPLVVKG